MDNAEWQSKNNNSSCFYQSIDPHLPLAAKKNRKHSVTVRGIRYLKGDLQVAHGFKLFFAGNTARRNRQDAIGC